MQSSLFFAAATNLLLLPLLLLSVPVVRAACYNVDLTDSNDAAMEPCDPNAAVSACCATNKGDRSDICLSSGLCYAQDNNYRGLIYMNGCTDKTGQSSECPHVCPDETTNWGGGSKVKSWNVLQCNKDTFCCRPSSDTANCCGNDSAVVSTNIGTLLLAASTTTATATASSDSGSGSGSSTVSGATSTSGPTVTVTAESCSSSSSADDKTAIVGGAVGGALGAALLASLAALWWLRRDRRLQAAGRKMSWPDAPTASNNNAESAIAHSPGYLAQNAKPLQTADGSYVPAQELSSRARHEML